MTINKHVVGPAFHQSHNRIADKVTPVVTTGNLIVNFSKFIITPICIKGIFNNHFKDSQHFADISAAFLGVVLPKITTHTYKEICDGSAEGRILHFHTIDDIHRKTVREILKEYRFPTNIIDQMFEGNDIVEFSASLGHVYPARIVCHKVKNELYPLFFDTNHHIYMNEKYLKESLFYEECPTYINKQCAYMPEDCFAVEYLDEELLKERSGYSYSP